MKYVIDTHQYDNYLGFSLEELGLPEPGSECTDRRKFFLGAVGSCLAPEACLALTTKIAQNAKLAGTQLFDYATQYLEAAGRQQESEMSVKRLGMLLHLDCVVDAWFAGVR